MKKLICTLLGHQLISHLDYIYGNLAREHQVCVRCSRTLKFERPTDEREGELASRGIIGDGAVPLCSAITS